MGCLFTEDPEVESPYHSETALGFYQQKLGLGPSGDHRIKEEFAFCLPTSIFFIFFSFCLYPSLPQSTQSLKHLPDDLKHNVETTVALT